LYDLHKNSISLSIQVYVRYGGYELSRVVCNVTGPELRFAFRDAPPKRLGFYTCLNDT